MAQTSVSVVTGFPGVTEFMVDQAEHRRQIARKLNDVNRGKFNCTVDVTLNPNTGATVIADSRIGFFSAVTPLMAHTLSGAVAIATGVWFDLPFGGAGSTANSIVAHHNITADVDKTIRFGIFG